MNAPHLTRDLPGTGGRLRADPADFLVEEIPLYEPCGVGDHTYLRIEKRGVPTLDAVQRIARALGVSPRAIGYAGLKDARAVAVQTLSVEHVDPARVEAALAEIPGVRLLGISRHRNKLKLGHLAGNRFVIRVRGVTANAEARGRAILAVLAEQGCPNRFGDQRFGRRGDNDVVGRALVRGDADGAVRALLGLDSEPEPQAECDADAAWRAHAAEGRFGDAIDALPRGRGTELGVLRELARGRAPERALHAIPRRVIRLLVSAYQSRLFNRLIDARLPELGRLETGDLAYLHDRGAVFLVEDAATEQPRADAFEISPSAPLFGTKTLLAEGAPGERERDLLAGEGLSPEDFRRTFGGELRGERRPVRVPVSDASLEAGPTETDADGAAEHSIVVRFGLPRGCYATTVLGEVTKDAGAHEATESASQP